MIRESREKLICRFFFFNFETSFSDTEPLDRKKPKTSGDEKVTGISICGPDRSRIAQKKHGY